MPSAQDRPVIGVTADIAADGRLQVGGAYAQMIERAGGTPIILPPVPARIEEFIRLCHGFVLTGGDDPDMTHWNIPMHPKATPLHPQRQAFELALLAALDGAARTPALGVCLGMQLMGLHRGGSLDQHLADSLATASLHWDRRSHEVEGELGHGLVHSHHRQALTHAGSLTVIARAPDGVIEAVHDSVRAGMYLGVQWHPERTDDGRLGFALFERLVHDASAARNAAGAR